jgi:hypothetical protein
MVLAARHSPREILNAKAPEPGDVSIWSGAGRGEQKIDTPPGDIQLNLDSRAVGLAWMRP